MAQEPSKIRDAIPDEALLSTNRLPQDDTCTKAVIWSPSEIDFPEWIRLEGSTIASGDAPAVSNHDVQGWYKYEVAV